MQSARLGSFSSFCSVASTEALIAVFINSDPTLKDSMIALSRIVSLLLVDRKWAKLFTVKYELPVKGDKMLPK